MRRLIQRFFPYFFIIAVGCSALLNARSFKNDQFKVEYGDTTFKWNNKLKLEGFCSKNLKLLNDANCDLDKTVVPGRFTLDSVFAHSQYNPDCDRELLNVRANARFKGTFGAPQSSFRTGAATIFDLDAVVGPHTHPINVHILILRELSLEVLLNDTFCIGGKHEHTFKMGLFPFSLGRGISLGDAYAVVPDFIGYDPEDSVEQYAPGFKFSGSLLDDNVLDYDAYVAILDNLSDTFSAVNLKTQGRFYGHRFEQARGFGVLNYIVAGRFKWTPVDTDCHKVYFEPYALYNHDKDQAVEVEGDASTKLGTFGLAMEATANNWEFGFDVAHNIGKQYVKGLDRNAVIKQRKSSITPLIGPDISAAEYVNSHVVTVIPEGSSIKSYNVPFDPNSDAQKALEKPIERAATCSSLKKFNGKVIEGVTVSNNNDPAVPVDYTIKNADDRFRDPYQNKFGGMMFVADAAYNFSSEFKLAGTVGYASGDENPNKDLNELGDSSVDGDYNGFISLQELYSGKRVQSAFLLSGKGRIPRILSFPINLGRVNVLSPKNLFPSSVTRFTNIAFVGTGLWWDIETDCTHWSINPNVLTFWQTHAARIPTNLVPAADDCDPCARLREPRECARQHLGTEINAYIEAMLAPGLKLFVVSGVFVPGGHFDDIKGLPLNKNEQKFLNRRNNSGETTEFVPTVGNDPAFFINAGLEYRF